MKRFAHWKFSGRVSELPFDPSLRKATTMMKMVVEGLFQLSESIDLSSLQSGEVSTFLGSLHGEIEPTLNYLKGLAQSGRARPFLFQNSLHHSTTGFASQKYHWIGPSYSICCIREPQREILQAGILHSRPGEPLLLIHCESFPEELSQISSYQAQDVCEIIYVDPVAAEALRGSTFSSFASFSQAIQFLNDQGAAWELR